MKKQVGMAVFCFIFLSFSFNVNTLNAQTKTAKKGKTETTRYFKTYLETGYESKKTVLNQAGRSFTNQSKYFKIFPSVAFSKTHAEGRLFEMSFALQNLEYRDDISESTFDSINIKVPTRGAETFSLAIGSRFEWAWQMVNTNKSQLYLGVSANPVFSYENVVPYTTANFPSYQYDLTTGFSIVPRWCLQLTDRLLLDFNLPLTFWEVGINHSYFGNPVLPTFAREETETKTKFLLKPILRIGLGVRI
jgi:hypothetical protein